MIIKDYFTRYGRVRNLFVAIDVSGSMDSSAKESLEELKQHAIVDNVHLILHDNSILKYERHTDWKDVTPSLVSSHGGTYYEPVFNLVNDQLKNLETGYNALVMITDGESSWPENRPNCDLAIISPKKAHLPGYATHLSRNELTLKKVYETLHSGESLSDEEVAYGVREFRKLEKALGELGPHFFLAWQRVMYDLDKLEDIQKARKER